MNINGSKTSNVIGDGCMMQRARWFCPADDAFLYQHQRSSSPPSWHRGFAKKARTPRPSIHHLPLVPEIGSDEPFAEENDEQLFDPFADDRVLNIDELMGGCDGEMVEFAANVESSLVGENGIGGLSDERGVKVEEEEEEGMEPEMTCHFDPALDAELNWDFDELEKIDMIEMENESEMKKNMLLRLNYGAVMAAWASQGSPWADGIRPQFDNLDEFIMGGGAWLGGRCRCSGGTKWAGREARVSRYREKRRRRLFCKKIRYEVRKLNADKGLRMKADLSRVPQFLGSSLPYK